MKKKFVFSSTCSKLNFKILVFYKNYDNSNSNKNLARTCKLFKNLNP